MSTPELPPPKHSPHPLLWLHERPDQPAYSLNEMRAAYRAGRLAGLEEAAKVVDVPADAEPRDYIGGEEGVGMLRAIARTIRALKEKQE